MKTPVTTIYLADDHQMTIDGLKLLISDEESIRTIGYANDGETAYNDIIVKKPDIALIDLRMPPGMSGLDLIHKLIRVVKNTRFIILSMHNDKRYIKDAMNAGASGYLLKTSGKTELMNCLSKVMKGEKYFPPSLINPKTEIKPLFTPREFEILKLIIAEYTTAEIATELCLSPLTVETHRKNIGRKTNTNTGLGLLKFLHENHIEL